MVFFLPSSLGEKGGLVSVGYGDDDFTRLDGDEDGYEEEDDENSRQSVSTPLLRELAPDPFHALQRLFSLQGKPLTGNLSWNPEYLTPGVGFSTLQILLFTSFSSAKHLS